MLSYLKVKNMAIIENVEIHFKEGFTALTGETGAGKSLLIDAIGLLLGDRATSSIIRTGFDRSLIVGIFTRIPEAVIKILQSLDIPYENEECLIQREITTSSTNVIKINQHTVTLSDLRNITQYLADIHTQHDTKRLINPATYLTLIDAYDPNISEALKAYKNHYQLYQKATQRFRKLEKEKDHALDKQMLIKAHLDELHKHQLIEGEEEALEFELKQLENFDAIFNHVNKSYQLLQDFKTPENLYEATKHLEDLSRYDQLYDDLYNRLHSVYYEVIDITSSLAEAKEELDFDPERLEELQVREHTLKTLSRKYRKTISELIVYQEELKKEYHDYDNFEDTLNEAYQALETAFDACKLSSLKLTALRKETAHTIEKDLVNLLKDLELKDVSFQIDFFEPDSLYPLNYEQFKEDGIDTIDFLLSTNLGETLKPLSKVASGGELSRIMLVLKELFMRNMNLSLMIFDEIDSGVSGFVANQVGQKMKNIAKKAQVLSITHLPQVASKADQHYYIYKTKENNRTIAHVKELSHDERIEALAEMISSDTITDEALKSAAKLLK